MAEEDTKEAEDGEGQNPEGEESTSNEKSSKGSLKLLGGVVGLIATGTILAVMAMPKKEAVKTLLGPGMHSFYGEAEFVGNPLDDNFSRYLKFAPSCQYFAYDLAYPELRRADPGYEMLLKEVMQHTVSQFRIDEVMGSNKDLLAEALERVAEPILFPVHIGETKSPYDEDPLSGLRVGESQERRGVFRGYFYEHVLKVDAVKKTLQLDDGPELKFKGGEYDLLVESENGESLYVDVANLPDDFVGEVNVGVMGRIRRLLTGDIIAQ